MAGTIFNMARVYKLFDNPLSPSQQTPLSKLTFGSAAQNYYSKTIAKNASSEMSTYLSSLYTNTSELKSNAKEFSLSSKDNTTDKMSVSSKDLSLSGTAQNNATAEAYVLNISSLATAQINKGTEFSSKSAPTVSTGTNTIKITTDKSEKNISFNVSANDSQKATLTKMATAINNSKSGFKASVENNLKTGNSYLKLQSEKTGKDNSFTISDVKGNAVAATGISNTATKASDATYKVDGKEETSSTNSVELQDGKVKINFTKAEGKDVEVKVGIDTKAITTEVNKLVNSFNKTLKFASDNSSNFNGASKLHTDLGKLSSGQAEALKNIGIKVNSSGQLSLDRKAFEKSLTEKPDITKNTLAKFSDGLTNKVNDVSNSPKDYVNMNVQNMQASIYNNLQNKYTYGNITTGSILDTVL